MSARAPNPAARRLLELAGEHVTETLHFTAWAEGEIRRRLAACPERDQLAVELRALRRIVGEHVVIRLYILEEENRQLRARLDALEQRLARRESGDRR